MHYDIEQLAAADAPNTATFCRIYRRAFAPAPLVHDPATVEIFTQLYGQAREHPDLIVCVARHRDGDLVGLCYGYRWHWSDRTDPRSQDLRSRLDDAAVGLLDGAFAVGTLAVDAAHQGHGVGSMLLQSAVDASACSRAWLLTEELDNPALRLYRAKGWTELGLGPPTGDRRTLALTRGTSVPALPQAVGHDASYRFAAAPRPGCLRNRGARQGRHPRSRVRVFTSSEPTPLVASVRLQCVHG